MSKRIKGSHWLAAAFLAGVVGIGGSALTNPALAEDNKTAPDAPKAGCQYAGQSYSDGSVRPQDVVTDPDKSTETKYYKCRTRPESGSGSVKR